MNAKQLKRKLKLLQPNLKERDAIRLHRAISWLNCAEENEANKDIQFISLWISFNSCYASTLTIDQPETERTRFSSFLEKIIKNDVEGRFYKLLWEKFSGPIRILLENQFLYKPFWDYQQGILSDWRTSFEKSNELAMTYLSQKRVPELLETVLKRLYVLRNQMIHGGATYNSKINRVQLNHCYAMLSLIVPLIIEMMLENSEEDWGELNYPVVL